MDDLVKKVKEVIDIDLHYLTLEGSEFIDRSTIKMIEIKLLAVISDLEKINEK